MLFEYVGEIAFKNNWSNLLINFPADDNTLYILIPKDNDYVKNVIVDIFGGKYSYMACSESTVNGALISNNYTLEDGTVYFSTKVAENKVETINFELYKRSL